MNGYESTDADVPVQVEKATMTEGLYPEPVRVRPKERGGRWGHASPFMRGSTIVRSQTFSPGARSQYVCRVSVAARSPFICGSVLDRLTLLLFSYIAATATAPLYQRNPRLSETRWKEEPCAISRYSPTLGVLLCAALGF